MIEVYLFHGPTPYYWYYLMCIGIGVVLGWISSWLLNLAKPSDTAYQEIHLGPKV